MVRNIVVPCWRSVAGKTGDLGNGLLAKQDRTQAGMTAPADGLYFVNAFYPEAFELPVVELNELLWQG